MTYSSLCKEKLVSQQYGEFIFRRDIDLPDGGDINGGFCRIDLAYGYTILSVPVLEETNRSLADILQEMLPEILPKADGLDYTYHKIPRLFGLMDTTALEESGILRIQNQPALDLKGQGVMIGFIDTGIDYTHPAFRYDNGVTKIHSIWDMTQESDATQQVPFGVVYTREQIQQAIESDDPLQIVPGTDEEGHGTFLAGVAAGSENIQQDFIGAAPMSQIVMVKLRLAKQYLRDYFQVKDEAVCYSESDMMLALEYLREVWMSERKPMVICIGVGTNTGDHAGNAPVAQYMNVWSTAPGIAIVQAVGNEGDKQHHFRGGAIEENTYEDVEIRVAQGEKGFYMELWGRVPEIYSVGILSPGGEVVARISPLDIKRRIIDFVFEDTRIDLSYALPEEDSGNEVIVFRFMNPTPGIWTIRVYGENLIGNGYHMWLPIQEFLSGDTYFLQPDPEITLTIPSDASLPISVSTYNHVNGGFFIESGRGYPLNGYIKPDICAPGVNVWGTYPRGRYGTKSGSSVSAAITAGACAQFLTWGIVKGKSPQMNTQEIKNYLIRGADREDGALYPMRTFGYGKLNVYKSFRII